MLMEIGRSRLWGLLTCIVGQVSHTTLTILHHKVGQCAQVWTLSRRPRTTGRSYGEGDQLEFGPNSITAYSGRVLATVQQVGQDRTNMTTSTAERMPMLQLPFVRRNRPRTRLR